MGGQTAARARPAGPLGILHALTTRKDLRNDYHSVRNSTIAVQTWKAGLFFVFLGIGQQFFRRSHSLATSVYSHLPDDFPLAVSRLRSGLDSYQSTEYYYTSRR